MHICSVRSMPAFAIASALALVGCSSDSPTAAPAPTHPSTFTVGPAGSRTTATTASVSRVWPTIANRQVLPVSGSLQRGSGVAAAATINSPFDLTFAGGKVLTGGTNWNLYMNCGAPSLQCWGSGTLSPSDFLKDLNRSRFISLLDQYVTTPAWRSWAFDSLVGNDPNIPANNNVLTDNELFNILYSAVQVTGQSGYRALYHVFLPQGVDVCPSPTACYSPDVPSTFAFCAYHGAVTFTDGTHIVYSVEPYQAVPGCQNPNGLPHGTVDATASTLSHEFFEAATDPDLDAWFNVLTGNEVGDLCFVFEYNEQIATHNYQIQSEYSNALHACSDNAR